MPRGVWRLCRAGGWTPAPIRRFLGDGRQGRWLAKDRARSSVQLKPSSHLAVLPCVRAPVVRRCRWLAKDEDDGQLRRRLKVSAAGGATTDYRVTTYTSDIR